MRTSPKVWPWWLTWSRGKGLVDEEVKEMRDQAGWVTRTLRSCREERRWSQEQ